VREVRDVRGRSAWRCLLSLYLSLSVCSSCVVLLLCGAMDVSFSDVIMTS